MRKHQQLFAATAQAGQSVDLDGTASSSALASLRSAVSWPSVNEEYISASWARSGLPYCISRRYTLRAAFNCRHLAPAASKYAGSQQNKPWLERQSQVQVNR